MYYIINRQDFLHMQQIQVNPQAPMILGHEAAGIVAKVGSNVKHLQVGSEITVEMSLLWNLKYLAIFAAWTP